ncbi:MAG: hypothetical protein HGA45_25050 [Chloroflexales bacterium]|nr:hypothetical protein [Chloroflexales bacterium]
MPLEIEIALSRHYASTYLGLALVLRLAKRCAPIVAKSAAMLGQMLSPRENMPRRKRATIVAKPILSLA